MSKKYSLHDNKNILKAKKDRDYLGELMIKNENLIWFTIRNYVGEPSKLAKCNGMELDDIFQIGCIGFITAVNNFDCNRGTLFTTYAPTIIAGNIKEYLRNKGRLIRLSRSAYELNAKIFEYTEDLYYNKYLPVEDIAEELNEDVDKIKKILTVGKPPFLVIPLNSTRNGVKHERKKDIIIDLLPSSSNTEKTVLDKMYLDQLLETVRLELGERDERILNEKLSGKTHKQIAKQENVSKITVTRTINRIKKLLREID